MATKSDLAKEILDRREARRNFRAWCLLCGFNPAKHHDLIIDKIQAVAESPTPRYIILEMPPGAAKSTYTSALAPPWFMGKRPGSCILACSYSKDLVTSFGRRCRNYVDERENVLGFSLKADTKAADEWESSNGGRYFCAGVGAGIAGHRADLGLIDDYLGNQEDADSKTVRDKQWDWFKGDFYPRLKPNASIFIIANRRHEDDLIGRLTQPNRTDFTNDSPIPPEQWEVIRLPFFAEKNDPLGREVGARLWPEWFTEEQAKQINRLNPRIRSGLYQQRPAPEDGDFFKQTGLVGYEEQDLPSLSELRIYAASDHGISTKEDACPSCMGGCGVDSQGVIWILPDLRWQRMDSMAQVNNMLSWSSQHHPIYWRAEKGHITQSIGPFLRKRMKETKIWINIREVTPKRDKVSRARSIQGLCELGKVHFPKFAKWWPEAENQMLTFPGSRENDFVDFLAHLGAEVEYMTNGEVVSVERQGDVNELPVEPLTLDWIRQSSARRSRRELVEF